MLPTGNAATYPYPFWPNSNMSRFKDLVRQNVNLLLRLETFEKPPYMRSVSKYDLQFREKNRVRFQPQDQTKHLLLPPSWSKHSLCAIAIPAILEILMLSSFFCLLLVAWPPNQQLNLIQLLELWHIWGAVAESAPFEPLAASEDLPLPYGEEGTDGHSPGTPHVGKYINKNTIFENLD